MAYLSFPVSRSVDPSSDDLGMKCLHPMCDKNAAQNASSGESSNTVASQDVGNKVTTAPSIVMPEVKFTILTGPAAISMGPGISKRPVFKTVNFRTSPLPTAYNDIFGSNTKTSTYQTEHSAPSSTRVVSTFTNNDYMACANLNSTGSASYQSAVYCAPSPVFYMGNESSTLSQGCLIGIVIASVLGGLMIIAVIVVLYLRFTRHRDRHDVELPRLDPFLQTISSRERSSKSDKGWSLPESDQDNRSSINLQSSSSSHTESLPDSSILSSHEQIDANPRSNRTCSMLPGQMFQPQFVDSVIKCLEGDIRRSVGPVLWRSNQEYLPRYSPV